MSGQTKQTPTPTTSTPETTPTVDIDPYQANYQDLYGDRVGGRIWNQIDKNANPDKLDGYLGDMVNSGTSSLSGLLTEHASPEDQEAAALFGQHLQGTVGTDLKARLADSDLSENIFGMLGENPLATGLLGLGAAGAYIASNPDLKGEVDFDLTRNTELTLGGDAGSLFDIGLHEAHGQITRTDGNQKYGLGAAHDFDQNRSTLSGFYNTHNGLGTSLAADGSFTHQGDRNSAQANLRYNTPEWGARLGGTWDSAHPEFGDYSTLQGSVFSRGEGPSQWNVGGSMDNQGAYRLNGGYNWSNESSSFGIEGHTGRDAMGNNDTGIMARFTHRF